MVVISSTIAVGPIAHTLSADAQPLGEGGKALEQAFPRFADDLAWWIEDAYFARENRAQLIKNSAEIMGYNIRCRICNVTHALSNTNPL